jgi:hypothetical protein
MKIDRPKRGLYIDVGFVVVLLFSMWARGQGASHGTDYFLPIVLVFFLVGAVYRATTPFFVSDRGQLVVYGFAPWQRRSFVLETISEVRYNVSGSWLRSGIEVCDNASALTKVPVPWARRDEAVGYADELRKVLGSKFRVAEG